MIDQRIQLAISAVLVLFFLLAASRGLGENTSYWADELWSVSASRADWSVMLRDWLIPDTHPPLYQDSLALARALQQPFLGFQGAFSDRPALFSPPTPP
ncbi:hypothetical protein [Synechococcus sp. BA-132 BA5]|uniref:hypothetical protein n=1 Tax=Synechococcus sp. BA-132 BA5 TaxID=3110252 RepID=UPI002B20AD9E|nr:hypothetical protein [Synechococcus sp. BA-132 BA5]MEA5414086.1 hypothetical protein [Synechococcus sp. BA-132 BA5]